MRSAEFAEQAFSIARRLLPGVYLWGWWVALLDFLFLASNVLLFAAFLIFSLRTYKRDPIREYPFRVALLSMVPFSVRWRNEVAAEHVCAIDKSRKGFFIFLMAAFVVAVLRVLYGKLLFARLHNFH
jgi:hypothetical protein